ncbi:MAG: 4-hydroxy-3-methylbut-2-enyl diphosphate reductase [Elusimicrobia bacterium]|nr:4-hydroxy-3-methylbut-2-enyl diphosphate reductase [Elusimicrobiota bacterium]
MEKAREIILAKSAGFCPGVKKALERVRKLAEGGQGPVFTLGPLVHNGQVLSGLEAEGIRAVESLDELKGKSGVLVLRAHGVTPEVETQARGLGLSVVDATCPLVKKAQNAVSRYAAQGYDTVIVGDAGHAEVIGLVGYAKERVFVVSGPEEAEKLPDFDKVSVVAQTTQEEDVFRKTVEVIKSRSKNVVVSDTICKPSRDRQRETVELCRSADLMVVVGSKKSANTARLAAICRRLCPQTLFAESAADLDAALVESARRVGVTAGASAPDSLIREIVSALRRLG